MPQAQNWNKSQSLQSTLFFPPLLVPLCMPFFVLLSLTLSCLPPPYSTTAIFLFASPLYLMPICTRLPFFSLSTLRSSSFPCVLLFFSEMLCCRDETSGYIYKKAKQSDAAGSNKRENLFSACNWKQHHSESLCFPIAKINVVCPWCRGAVELRNGMANVQVIQGWFITTKQATMETDVFKWPLIVTEKQIRFIQTVLVLFDQQHKQTYSTTVIAFSLKCNFCMPISHQTWN